MKRITENLEKWLYDRAASLTSEALKPLPATRTLGNRFEVSHGTVFRMLCRMEEEGRVWRHPNGRFYPALARRVLGKPKPLGVMLRRMASWSSLSREVMEGFTEQCGAEERPILLFHNKELLVQETPESQPRIASPATQENLLRDFFLLHGESVGGVLFDELWSDEAIRNVLPAGMPTVSFYRSCDVEGTGSVAANFRTGALLAMSHLMVRGYEQIYLIEPFRGYAPAQSFLKAGQAAYLEITGDILPAKQQIPLYEPLSEKALLRRISNSKGRLGLICPEDNLSLHLAETLRAAGISPGKCGLVSAMGTSAIDSREITCVRYDFLEMGHLAAQMLCSQKLDRVLMEPTLEVGASTRG